MSCKKFILLIIFILLTSALFAFGGREKDQKTDEPLVEITGTVRLVGSANFSEIVISNSDSIWYVPKDEMEKLFDLQQRTVTVKGTESVHEMTFASGLPAGTRRELSNIIIVSVE